MRRRIPLRSFAACYKLYRYMHNWIAQLFLISYVRSHVFFSYSRIWFHLTVPVGVYTIYSTYYTKATRRHIPFIGGFTLKVYNLLSSRYYGSSIPPFQSVDIVATYFVWRRRRSFSYRPSTDVKSVQILACAINSEPLTTPYATI